MTRLWKLAFVVVLALPCSSQASEAAEAAHARTPAAILQDLKEGNARFVSGKATRPHATPKRVKELVSAQHPEAIVLGCSDSRVPPEVIFDEGLGDLFVVRVAGNVSEPATLGSIEYAAEHLHVPLVVVLGHHKCGAVKAATEANGEVEGNVGAIIKEIQPAVATARSHPGKEGLVDDAVHANVALVARQLVEESPIVKKLVAEGKVKVVTAVYDLGTGTIDWQ
jgi:carbonic anhydrase